MRTLHSLLGLVTLTVTFAALAGCAAPTESSDDAASASTEDPRGSLATSTKAISLLEGGKTTTIGAPKKLAAVMAAIEGSVATVGGLPRCPPAYTLTYLDAKAKPIATLSRCGPDKGYLKVGSDVFELPVADEALHDTFAAAPAVGDLLWGVDEMISAENEDGSSQRDPATIALWSKAFNHDDTPKTLAAPPSDEKLQTFTFRRAGKEAAEITIYAPANDDDMSGPATISVDGAVVGWTTVSLSALLGGGF